MSRRVTVPSLPRPLSLPSSLLSPLLFPAHVRILRCALAEGRKMKKKKKKKKINYTLLYPRLLDTLSWRRYSYKESNVLDFSVVHAKR